MKLFDRLRHALVRKGAWVLIPMALIGSFFPSTTVQAADGNKLVFAYQEAVVYQEVNVPNNWSSASSLTATISAAEVQDWKTSSDTVAVAINLYGDGGGGIYSHSTGYITLTDNGTFNDYSLTVTAAGVGAGWASVASVRISIIGNDGEFWAGNYGTQVETASLKLDGTELLANTEFTSNTGWTSSLGWQTCSGNSGGLPCIGLTAVQINNPTTTTTSSTTTTTTIPEPETLAFPNAGFESNNFDGWEKGSQTGTLGASITGSGTGVSVFTGSKTFTHGSRNAVGSPTVNGSPNPYYAPAVSAGSWTFSPNNASYAAALQPKNEQTFAQAMTNLGLSGSNETAIRNQLTADAAAASNGGSPNPTDAAWITREVELIAGNTYTMSWNYVGTDYVPFNDGSITSLVAVNVPSTPVITVNNFTQSYAFLGFTNPGTGDYSTNSFGATGWQMSTYQVSVSGTYKLGFAVFNLGDTSLSPVLMIDNAVGNTDRCVPAGSNCTSFGGVAPNNETAPTVVPTTTSTTSTTTTTTTTTTVPAPTSLEVTSLLDDGSSGTLRWAITQANAQAGGIYDAITITQQGTITLTSDLPAITAGVSITGTGRNTTIIDGVNLYRQIYSAGARNVTIQDLTLKQGKNVSWNGGTIYNSQGTFTITNVRITASPGWAFYQHNGGVTTFTNCVFDNNNAGVTSDHGSTPSTMSTTDTNYSNRIYINNSQFSNNTYGIFVERFARISGSTFTNNIVGAYLRGLNRQQVYSSQFTDNGTAISFSSWIPTTWTPGADNQLVQGNNFTTNGTAIQFGNNFNNGSTVFNGTSSNAWSTSRNNTFEENTTIYQGQGYVVDSDTVVTTTTTTTTTVPQTTTTTEAPAPQTTTTTEPEVVVAPVDTLPDTTVPEETTPTTEVTLPTETIEEDTTTTTEPEVTTTTEPPAETPVTTIPEETETVITEEEIANIVENIDELPTEEVVAVLEELVTEDIPVEQLTEVLEAVFAEPLSDEEFAAVIDAVITEDITAEQLEAVLDVLESDTVSEEQVAEVVDKLIENGVTEDQATELATSSKVLESIDTTQAEAIFEAIPVGDLTQEQEAALVAAVTDAPQEVKETFEATIDIFGEGLDEYVPVGSQVDVGSRRTLIAASTAVASIAGAAATAGGSGGPTGGSGGSSGGSGGGNTEGRSRREEEGEEPAGEIAGPEDDDDEEYTRNSIFNYYLEEGIWKKKISWLGLVRKFVNETAALAFTLAGSVVVFITLSGDTRKTAMIATGVALAVHYVHVLLKNDEA